MASSDTDSAGSPLVLITGAAGLIGTRLIERLHNDYTILAADINVRPTCESTVDWFTMDLTSDDSVENAIQQIAAEYGPVIHSVIHLASHDEFSDDPSPLYQSLTIDGTRRLMSGLRDFQVNQIVFAGSLLVMKPDDQQISEVSPTQAEWAYPESKLEAERILESLAGDCSTVILRIAGVYDDEGHSLPLSQQISRIYERPLEGYVFPGDANAGQVLVHLDDLAECFHRVLKSADRLGSRELFLIGESNVMSYEQLQESIGMLIHGERWSAMRIPTLAAKVGAWVKTQFAVDNNQPLIRPWMVDLADDNYSVDVRHARTELGWEPSHSLKQTLPTIIAGLHADPHGWYDRHGLTWPEDRDDLPVDPPLEIGKSQAVRRPVSPLDTDKESAATHK